MDGNITINIVEPGTPPSPTPTPVDPSSTGADIAVPDTGLFTHGIGAPEATIISVAIILVVAAIVIAVLYSKYKKQNKTTKLVRIIDQTKAVIKSKKCITAGLTALALLISAGTFIALARNGANASDNDTQDNQTRQVDETNEETETTATVEDGVLTVELGDTPVFAYIPITITIDEDMPAGYTLKAYAEETELKAEGVDKAISMVAPANSVSGTAELTDNTWGLAIDEPESQASKVFYSLSDNIDDAIIVTDKDYRGTKAGDTATVYYGVYITPDMPYGTYTGAKVGYEVKENRADLAKVTFDGNGLYFNDDPGQTTNVVRYEISSTDKNQKKSYTPNIDENGNLNGDFPNNEDTNDIIVIPGATSLHIELRFGGKQLTNYTSFWSGKHPEYRASNEADVVKAVQQCGDSAISNGKFGGGEYSQSSNLVECDLYGTDSVTFSYTPSKMSWARGQGYYAIVTGYDANGEVVSLVQNMPIVGEYEIPSSHAPHLFFGWSEDKNAMFATYKSVEDIRENTSLDLENGTVLYAIWDKQLYINYNGNGASGATDMNNIEQYASKLYDHPVVDLLASNFTKEGYGFAGWSTDEEAWEHLTDNDEANDPIIYGPNQTITIDEDLIAEAGDNRKLILNAVWVPAETTANGDPVELQGWQGCSNLTATTYDAETGTLNVGKNTITALTDSRDGNVYTVARLADGNCWMTENLRLDNSGANRSTTSEFSSANTNNPLLPLTNDYASQVLSNRLSIASDDWCDDSVLFTAACFDQSRLNTFNTTPIIASPEFSQDFTDNAHKDLDVYIVSYGNYYNWYSATAGNGKQETINAMGDICPAGWGLPMGIEEESSASFWNLAFAMESSWDSSGSNKHRSFPNNFIYSGNWTIRRADHRGQDGHYWSSTAASDNANGVHSLSVSSYSVYPAMWMYKYLGLPVRCVASAQ